MNSAVIIVLAILMFIGALVYLGLMFGGGVWNRNQKLNPKFPYFKFNEKGEVYDRGALKPFQMYGKDWKYPAQIRKATHVGFKIINKGVGLATFGEHESDDMMECKYVDGYGKLIIFGKEGFNKRMHAESKRMQAKLDAETNLRIDFENKYYELLSNTDADFEKFLNRYRDTNKAVVFIPGKSKGGK